MHRSKPELLTEAEIDAVSGGTHGRCGEGEGGGHGRSMLVPGLTLGNIEVVSVKGHTVTLENTTDLKTATVRAGLAVAYFSGATGAGLLSKLPQ